MKEKSENFNSLRAILFELCKKTTRGGQIDPPPAGIGLRLNNDPTDILTENIKRTLILLTLLSSLLSSQNKLNNFLFNKTYRFTSRNNKNDSFF